jgi:hypothetical protein
MYPEEDSESDIQLPHIQWTDSEEIRTDWLSDPASNIKFKSLWKWKGQKNQTTYWVSFSLETSMFTLLFAFGTAKKIINIFCLFYKLKPYLLSAVKADCK